MPTTGLWYFFIPVCCFYCRWFRAI